MNVKTEEWRRLHNEEPHIVRVIKTNEVGGGMCNVWGQERCTQVFGGET